jgi:hypothetical protein
VGVERGTTYQMWAQQNLVDKDIIPQADLIAYDGLNAMVTALNGGKVDLVLVGAQPAQQVVRRNRNIRIAGAGFNEQQMAIAARKGSTLIAQFNEALARIQTDGTFAELVDQYLGLTPSDVETGVPVINPEPEAAPEPPRCIYGMAYVADLNLDDKNMTAPPVMQPGQQFTKQWRVQNTGTCAWEADFQLAYVSGNRPEAQMGGTYVNVGRQIQPGQTWDVSVNLVAPQAYGTFQAFWRMRDSAKQYFGETIWVGIQVPDPNPPPPPPPPPPDSNVNLRADSTYIVAGQCTTIRWDVDNVNAVFFVDGNNVQGVGGHDSRTVCPTTTTTYALRVVYKDNSSVDYPITITVSPSSVSISFWADNTSIQSGQCTTLHWQVVNGKAVYLDQGSGEALVGGTDSIQICPTVTTTYVLRVERLDGGQEYRQVTVNVNSPTPAPSITTFTASSNEVVVNACVTLRWEAANTTSVNLSRSGVRLLQNAGPHSSYQDCLSQQGLYDYRLDAFGNGQTSQQLTVQVIGPQPK